MNIYAKKTTDPDPYEPAHTAGLGYSRRTTTDEIFDQIHSDIASQRLKPGTKVSEVEIAKRFAVSRQPVREAFIRLSNMGLLLVRPQRATIVRKISLKEVAGARFVRTAIEVEVARVACERFEARHEKAFEANLEAQRLSVLAQDYSAFSKLDAEFHKLMCLVADCEQAHQRIAESKIQVERLCALSLAKRTEFEQVYNDHVALYRFLKQGDADKMIALLRTHLSRLDVTIREASQSNQDMFED
jgi:DNA-binding GntR family transcriptional regulator